MNGLMDGRRNTWTRECMDGERKEGRREGRVEGLKEGRKKEGIDE